MEITFYFSDEEIQKLEKEFNDADIFLLKHINKLGSVSVDRHDERRGQMNRRIFKIEDEVVRANLINRAWNEGTTVNKLILKEIVYPLLSAIEA